MEITPKPGAAVISIGFIGKPKYFSKEKSGRPGSWCCEPRPASAHGKS
jgi:hypothetical protein